MSTPGPVMVRVYPDWVRSLAPLPLHLMIVIYALAREDADDSPISARVLSEVVGCHRSDALRALRDLGAGGYVLRDRPGPGHPWRYEPGPVEGPYGTMPRALADRRYAEAAGVPWPDADDRRALSRHRTLVRMAATWATWWGNGSRNGRPVRRDHPGSRRLEAWLVARGVLLDGYGWAPTWSGSGSPAAWRRHAEAVGADRARSCQTCLRASGHGVRGPCPGHRAPTAADRRAAWSHPSRRADSTSSKTHSSTDDPLTDSIRSPGEGIEAPKEDPSTAVRESRAPPVEDPGPSGAPDWATEAAAVYVGALIEAGGRVTHALGLARTVSRCYAGLSHRGHSGLCGPDRWRADGIDLDLGRGGYPPTEITPDLPDLAAVVLSPMPTRRPPAPRPRPRRPDAAGSPHQPGPPPAWLTDLAARRGIDLEPEPADFSAEPEA